MRRRAELRAIPSRTKRVVAGTTRHRGSIIISWLVPAMKLVVSPQPSDCRRSVSAEAHRMLVFAVTMELLRGACHTGAHSRAIGGSQ